MCWSLHSPCVAELWYQIMTVTITVHRHRHCDICLNHEKDSDKWHGAWCRCQSHSYCHGQAEFTYKFSNYIQLVMGSTMLFRTLIKLSRRVLLQCRVLHKCWYSLAHKSSVFKRALVGGTGCTLRHFTQWSHVTCCVFLYSRLSMKLTPINRPITKTLYCRVMH